MPNFCDEFHSRRSERVLFWEIEMSFEESTLAENKLMVCTATRGET
jgi:hypothetical protein